jgi:hypothetical protein
MFYKTFGYVVTVMQEIQLMLVDVERKDVDLQILDRREETNYRPFLDHS